MSFQNSIVKKSIIKNRNYFFMFIAFIIPAVCSISPSHAKNQAPVEKIADKKPNQEKTHHAHPTDICNIRIWPSPDSTRVVFDLSKNLQYTVETPSATKVIIELKNARLKMDPKLLKLENSRIKNIQTATRNKNLYIEFELTRSLKPNVFTLSPNQQYGDRLVLDLEMDQNERDAILALFEDDAPVQETQTLANTTLSGSNNPDILKTKTIADNACSEKTAALPVTPPVPTPDSRALKDAQSRSSGSGASNSSNSSSSSSPQAVKTLVNKKSPFIVAIDPGHGGEDPGAIGKRGTREKDVVLAISRHLKSMIDKEPNMHAILIRNGDYYIALHERVRRARAQRADLFISIHADAFHDKRADGASVFTLSERGASSAAARWLAVRENKSDLIGGVKLSDKTKVLASVLLDLSQTKSKEEGYKAAKYVLSSLGNVGTLHGGRVEQAGFAVLKAPDIPSMLVETGFISNWNGEAKLRQTEHQRKIAKAILEGIRRYAAQRPH